MAAKITSFVAGSDGHGHQAVFEQLIRSAKPGLVHRRYHFGGEQVVAHHHVRVHAELTATLREPKVAALIVAQGATAQPQRMEEFAVFIERERARYGALVKRAKVPVED